MASTKSQSVQDIEAQPTQFVDHRIQGGKVRVLTELVTFAAADGAGHIHAIGLVPSRAVMLSVKFAMASTVAGSTDLNLGFYTISAGNDPVDANGATSRDVLFDGQTWAVAAPDFDTDMLGLGTNGRPAASGLQPAWQIAGLSADPKVNYVICLAAVSDVTAPGTALAKILYSDGA
jgi:hypothetical protein